MVEIDGNQLSLEQIEAVARHNTAVTLVEKSRERMLESQHWVEQIIADGKPVYGINTGFGIFADRSISPVDLARLSRNLILSHALSTGEELSIESVRAAMLIRANTLAAGFSGVRPLLVHTILEMLNKGVTPAVPSQGSLGSSGDLAPLSHLALVFTTDLANKEDESGWAYFQGNRMTGLAAMQAADIPRLILGAKEGLAVNNGATFSTAIAALAVRDAAYLLDIADIALAMSLEAMLGASAAFDERLHDVRHHPGQINVARRVRELTQGSTLLDAGGKVQDAYSLRCAPQIQGAARDALIYISEVIQREINAATDNPLLFASGEAISGGNFHGEPIGLVMDFLSIAMAEVAAISERRIFRLTDSKLNAGLTPMLVDTPEAAGLNSGMMMAQYTAASLVLENQTYAHPDSVHSLPTSAEQEDHNANSMTAARNTHRILDNVCHVLAIEIYCAARALDIRFRQIPGGQMGKGVEKTYHKVREYIPYQPGDALWGPEIEALHKMIQLQLI